MINELIERLTFLATIETFVNDSGVTISHHLNLGDIEWQEQCAEFVASHGLELVAMLSDTIVADEAG